MGELMKIVAPTNNINDTSVVVYQFLVDDGTEVKEGQEVIAVETSKATTNIESPTTGYIKFVVEIGDEIPNGELLAYVAETIQQLENLQTRNQEAVSTVQQTRSPVKEQRVAQSKSIAFGLFDKPITLGEIYFKNGEYVEAGATICKIRTENKTETIKAESAGYVHWSIDPYKAVAAGEALGILSDSPAIEGTETKIQYQSLRVSKAAQYLLDNRNLSASDLGLTGLVTVQDVRGVLEPKKDRPKSNTIVSREEKQVVHFVEGQYQKLSKSKKLEATFLTEANNTSVVSQVSVLVPTRGIFSSEDTEITNKFSSIIIFETGRLLKNYKQMTAVFDNDQLFVYDHINIGYALSIDDGLKVPVFKEVDKKDLDTIISEKERFIEKYVTHELSADDLGGGTFTITDLSSTGCYMFNPVLNLGQSVILGVGGENPEKTNYPLILAFDHRVTDGATATEFLIKLRDRLVAHENVLLGTREIMGTPFQKAPGADPIDLKNLACDFCFRTADELDEMGHYLFKVIDKSGKEKHICSICMRGW